MFWVISVYFNIRNTLPKFCPFLLGHSVYMCVCVCVVFGMLIVLSNRMGDVALLMVIVWIVNFGSS